MKKIEIILMIFLMVLIRLVSASNITIVSPTPSQIFTQESPTALLNISTLVNVTLCYWNDGTSNYSMASVNTTYFYNLTAGSKLLDGFKTTKFYCNDSLTGEWYDASVTYLIDSVNITTCRNLTVENRNYNLLNYITTTATCLNIISNNITLDCNGKNITYSTTDNDYEYGIMSSSNYTTIKNCLIYKGPALGVNSHIYSIYFINANNGQLNNNTIELNYSSNGDALFLENSKNNLILNNNITSRPNPTAGSSLAVDMRSNSHNNTFRGNTIQCYMGSYCTGLYLSQSNYTTFYDGTITSTAVNHRDVRISTSFYLRLINTTYDLAGENYVSGSLTREWYFSAQVNYSRNGAAVNGANITAYNKSSTVQISELTDTSGNTSLWTLIEYSNSGSRVYYTNYSINMTFSGKSEAIPLNLTTNSFNNQFWINDLNISIFDILTPTGIIQNSTTLIKYNISAPDGLGQVNWSWDKTNYTLYDDSLVLFYNFDNRSVLGDNRTQVVDLSGNGYNGTFVKYPNVTFVAEGKYNGGVNFDNNLTGGGRSYIGTGLTRNFNNTGWSIGVWVKLNTCFSSPGANIITKWYDYRIYVNTDCTVSMLTRNVSGSGGDKYMGSIGSLSDKNWHNLWYIYNYSNNMSYAYFDGVFVKNISQEGIWSTDSEFQIGGGNLSLLFFNGTIDDVMIWNRTFSANEIFQMYSLSLTKHDSENWSMQMNETDLLNSTKINSTNPSYSINYFLCANNLINIGNCTSQKTLTFLIPTKSIISNFITPIGNIKNDFYGSNTHLDLSWARFVDKNNDGTVDTVTNYTWLREAFLDSGMKSMRGDMYLTRYFSGFGYADAEEWTTITARYANKEDCGIPPTWGCSSNANGFSTYQRSTNSHSGSYSVELINNGTGTTNYTFSYSYMFVKPNTLYNFTIWMNATKSNGAYFQVSRTSDYAVLCNGGNVAMHPGNSLWVQLSCAFNTTYSGKTRIDITVRNNSTLQWDELKMTENGILKNYTFLTNISSDANVDGDKDLVGWAYNNSIKILMIDISTPDFIENYSAYCYNSTTHYYDCPVRDYGTWCNILTDYINYTTNGGQWIDAVKVEHRNEPYASSFCGLLPYDHLNKSYAYIEEYNRTYSCLHNAFPTLEIGGPSGYTVGTTPNLIKTFISNASSYGYAFNFTTIHPYSSTSYISTNALIDAITNIYNNCSSLGTNCDNIILSEWSLSDANAKLNDIKFPAEIAFGYSSILNKYPSNITMQLYQYSEQFNYSNSVYYPEWPDRWAMVTEPQLITTGDPLIKPSFNVTKNYAMLCPPGGTVFQSSSEDTLLNRTTCKKGNSVSLIIINTGPESRNLTANFSSWQLRGLIGGSAYTKVGGLYQLGILDSYGILYLGSGIYGEYNNLFWDKDDILITETKTNQNVLFNNTASSSLQVRVYNSTKALIYHKNLSLPCGNSLINGNCNTTLSSGQSEYALNYFNLTEAVTRNNNPVNITEVTNTGSHITYDINNSLKDTISIQFYPNQVPCPDTIYLNLTQQNFSCSGNYIKEANITLYSGINQFDLNYESTGGQGSGGIFTETTTNESPDESTQQEEEQTTFNKQCGFGKDGSLLKCFDDIWSFFFPTQTATRAAALIAIILIILVLVNYQTIFRMKK